VQSNTWRALGVMLVALSTLVACGPAAGPRAPAAAGVPATRTGAKTVTVGISSDVAAMSIMGPSTIGGGWAALNEVHSQGLVTADREVRRPIPRLATQVPSFDNGAMELLADGRMKTVYRLRSDVTWHDGAPFTASDLVFSFEVNSDRNLPFLSREAIQQMEAVEAPDDQTLVIYWKAPYYQADSLGLRALWPHPRHILEEPYRTLDRQAFINLPYWTSEYIHLGPFRLTELRPGEFLSFSAYDGFFLGKPKLDRVIVRIVNDKNTLYASTLSGAVDMLMDISLNPDQGFRLKDEWEASGRGVVHIGTGATRFLSPQFDPQVQGQPAILEPRVRQALAFGLDRRAITEVVQAGHGELVANSLLPPGDRHYETVKDGFARYGHDPARARTMLDDLGWSIGPDGVLVGSDGRRFTTALWTTEGWDNEIAVIADYWKQIGVAAEERITVGGTEVGTKYPGFQTAVVGWGDSVLGRIDSRVASGAQNNFSGSNRGNYRSVQLDGMIDRYRQSVVERDQAQAIKQISDFVADELPIILLYFNPTRPAVRAGIRALDDFRGGAEASQPYGTFSRNAHEWDLG
jgi:peptide/nickel transport system substrate-binding protein